MDRLRLNSITDRMEEWFENNSDYLDERREEKKPVRVAQDCVLEAIALHGYLAGGGADVPPAKMAAIHERMEPIRRAVARAEAKQAGAFIKVGAQFFHDWKYLVDEANRFMRDGPPKPAAAQPAPAAPKPARKPKPKAKPKPRARTPI